MYGKSVQNSHSSHLNPYELRIMGKTISHYTEKQPIVLQNVAFGLALGESANRVAFKCGVSRRQIQYLLEDEQFLDYIRYWQELYKNTLVDALTTDVRRSIRNALVQSVSKNEALVSHPNKVTFTEHTKPPASSEELNEMAQKAETRQKMTRGSPCR